MKKIKSGDQVIVLAGRDKGRQGKVLKVLPLKNVVLVEGIKLVKKHTKPNPQKGVKGGIVSQESAIHISNIALYNPRTNKADKVGIKVSGEGRNIRIFKSDQEVVDI